MGLYYSMQFKKILFFAILIIFIIIINNLIHSIYTLWQKSDLVVQAQDELESEKKKNKELKRQLALISESEFVEQEARNKLFLAKPGEEIIVIPTDTFEPPPSRTPEPVETKQPWQQWWALFF